MISSMSEIEEELDGGIVADHMRRSDVNRFIDHDYVSFSNFGKSGNEWVNLLSRQKMAIDEASPHATSHLSPEPSGISDLTSFEYSQRLPSLESSSSAPIGRSLSGLTSQPLFAWQPFGASSSGHSHSQAQSLHAVPGGHLFPLVPGSVGSYGSEFPTHSPSSNPPINIPCGSLDSHDKPDSQFGPLAYANVSPAIVSSGCLLTRKVASPSGHELQPLRMDLGPTVPSSSSVVTPISAYAQSIGSSNSQPSTPAHQGFSFAPNGNSIPQQLNTSSGATLSVHSYDDSSKSVIYKQRSKKESHNRIERKRRDYINSQIVYLSSLLPPELYRDVDGRRNKGSVLRLSVNYIKDLRDAVCHMSCLKQENTLARQLIPLLLKRIEVLECALHEQGILPPGAPGGTGSSSNSSTRDSTSLEALYQSWLIVNESNQRSANNNSMTSVIHDVRVPSDPQSTSSASLGDSYYFQNMMHTDADPGGGSRDLDSISATKDSCTSSTKARIVNVKREQVEEDRLVESTPPRVRLDSCRVPTACGNSGGDVTRKNFTDLGSSSSRIDEEVTTPLNCVSFDRQPSLSYERYHRLMQPTRQSGGVFSPNE